jgi:hypothetical protein
MLALALQDNPERRGCAGLLGGNSTTHGVFGISYDFELLTKPFQACIRCRKAMRDYVTKGEFNTESVDLECEDFLGWPLEKLCIAGIQNYSRTFQ